ncbi:GTP 3',8-cyclase MoaA [Pectinatus haikarae]|uniref:GTP 3',8-cyclase MoaA n=1 Tax=Pectinatus haikarae TaxID=349096 RepID=UPI0018C61049|nr:GTP 3',8-cyclase MoaA [Pectinatus haikarae]
MLDKLGRSIDYLRVSLTNKCNMRCLYCRPAKEGDALSAVQPIQSDDLLYLLSIFIETGIKKIRLTGGEPLLFPEIINFIKCLGTFPDLKEIAMTTNGVLLRKNSAALINSGLSSINVSIDALTPAVFSVMTRGADINEVIEGIESVRNHISVKINSVIMKNINEQEIIPLADFSREYDIPVRFIELMPFSQTKDYEGMSEESIKGIISDRYGRLYAEKSGKSAAHYYNFSDKRGKIGFISAMSHKFCGSCNRVRLMADGCLRPCLYSDKEYDLKQMLKQNCSSKEITAAIKKIIYGKPEQHAMQKKIFFNIKHGFMSEIGG